MAGLYWRQQAPGPTGRCASGLGRALCFWMQSPRATCALQSTPPLPSSCHAPARSALQGQAGTASVNLGRQVQPRPAGFFHQPAGPCQLVSSSLLTAMPRDNMAPRALRSCRGMARPRARLQCSAVHMGYAPGLLGMDSGNLQQCMPLGPSQCGRPAPMPMRVGRRGGRGGLRAGPAEGRQGSEQGPAEKPAAATGKAGGQERKNHSLVTRAAS